MNSVIKSTLVSSFTVFITSTVFFLFSGGGSIEWLLSFSSALVITLVALVVIILWVIPSHYLIQKYTKGTIISYMLIGLVPSTYIPINHYFTSMYLDPVGDTLAVALVGIIVAISFKLSFRVKNT
ncbi:hypothetical protein [Thalassotalea montiporae]